MSTTSPGPERAARAAVDRGTLVVALDGTVVQTVPVGDRPVRVGRLPGNDVVLPHPAVSRHHAEVRAEAAGVVVADVGSTGGTAVDGVRLLRDQPALLTANTVVRVGPYEITYRAPRPAPTFRPPSGATFAAEAAAAGEAASGAAAPPGVRPAAVAPAAPFAEPGPPTGDALGAIGLPPAGAAPPGAGALVAEPDVAPAPAPGRPTFPVPLPAPPPAGSPSRYLQHLPAIFQDADPGLPAGHGAPARPNDFLGRMLLIFEALWEPLEQRQDHVALYYDPRTAPAAMLPWLASWLDLALDPRWPEERRRRLLAEAMELYRWRGTPYGLARILEISAGVSARVTDDPGAPWVLRVTVTPPPGAPVRREVVEALVREHKPAHVGYVLEFEP